MMVPNDVQPSPWLSRWQGEVGPISARSSRLVLALCAAFAAPLCAMAGVRPFLVHLYGPRAEGKDPNGRQLALRLPACVYGHGAGEWTYWNLMTNDLSRPSVEQRPEDGLMLLSDFDQVTTREVMHAAARWFEPRGKTMKTTGRRDRVTLSCGSFPIDPQVMRNCWGPGKAWVLNVPTDAGAGEGMFEVPTSDDERARVEAAANECGGYVGLHWLAHLNRSGRAIADRWAAERDFGEATALDPTTHLTALELAATFSRLATAGEEATLAGLTGWALGTAKAAVWKCLVDMVQADSRRAGRPPDAPGTLNLHLVTRDQLEGG